VKAKSSRSARSRSLTTLARLAALLALIREASAACGRVDHFLTFAETEVDVPAPQPTETRAA
jgi:hypothetical protein